MQQFYKKYMHTLIASSCNTQHNQNDLNAPATESAIIRILLQHLFKYDNTVCVGATNVYNLQEQYIFDARNVELL